MREQAKSWMESASSDLLLIEEIQNNELLTHMIAFHAQQAIEKIFKAILEENKNRVPKTHDLIVLNENVNKLIKIEFNQDILDQMNQLYIDSRYPTDIGLLPNGKPTIEESTRFYKYAKELFEFVNTKYK